MASPATLLLGGDTSSLEAEGGVDGPAAAPEAVADAGGLVYNNVKKDVENEAQKCITTATLKYLCSQDGHAPVE